MPRLSGPVPFRARGFTPRESSAAGAATLLLILVLWQVAAWRGWISTTFLSTPVDIARAIVALAQSGELWAHLSVSLQRLAVGWTVGTVAGLAVGFAAGLF